MYGHYLPWGRRPCLASSSLLFSLNLTPCYILYFATSNICYILHFARFANFVFWNMRTWAWHHSDYTPWPVGYSFSCSPINSKLGLYSNIRLNIENLVLQFEFDFYAWNHLLCHRYLHMIRLKHPLNTLEPLKKWDLYCTLDSTTTETASYHVREISSRDFSLFWFI